MAIKWDTPARAYVRQVKSRNGYFDYDKTIELGSHVSGGMAFPESKFRRQTILTYDNEITEAIT